MLPHFVLFICGNGFMPISAVRAFSLTSRESASGVDMQTCPVGTVMLFAAVFNVTKLHLRK
jgi:hypothetical protein